MPRSIPRGTRTRSSPISDRRVTAPAGASASELEAARVLAGRLGAPFVPRRGLARLFAETGAPVIAVAGRRGLAYHLPGGGPPLRFHGSLGVVRVRALARGGRDTLVDTLGVRPGDTVVDATAGAGSDALVLGHAVGDGGRVVALESSQWLAVLLAEGLARPLGHEAAVEAARRRVEVVHADHRPWLAAAAPASVDLVYLDPMFPGARAARAEFAVIRALADPAPLTRETLALAARVARRRVVVADGPDGRTLARLGLAPVTGAGHPRRRFGVLDV